jgi:hypothetical protein
MGTWLVNRRYSLQIIYEVACSKLVAKPFNEDPEGQETRNST